MAGVRDQPLTAMNLHVYAEQIRDETVVRVREYEAYGPLIDNGMADVVEAGAVDRAPERVEATARSEGSRSRSARRGGALPGIAHQAVVELRPPRVEQREELEPVAPLVEVEIRDEHGGAVARRLDQHPSVGVRDER